MFSKVWNFISWSMHNSNITPHTVLQSGNSIPELWYNSLFLILACTPDLYVVCMNEITNSALKLVYSHGIEHNLLFPVCNFTMQWPRWRAVITEKKRKQHKTKTANTHKTLLWSNNMHYCCTEFNMNIRNIVHFSKLRGYNCMLLAHRP